jgi:flagellar biosynthesis GTPase FlhF
LSISCFRWPKRKKEGDKCKGKEEIESSNEIDIELLKPTDLSPISDVLDNEEKEEDDKEEEKKTKEEEEQTKEEEEEQQEEELEDDIIVERERHLTNLQLQQHAEKLHQHLKSAHRHFHGIMNAVQKNNEADNIRSAFVLSLLGQLERGMERQARSLNSLEKRLQLQTERLQSLENSRGMQSGLNKYLMDRRQ